MNTNLIFFDFETSGVDNVKHSPLSLALYHTDLDLNPISQLHHTIILRPDAVVDQRALEVNKHNPFTKEWDKNSLTEKQLCGEVISFCENFNLENSLYIAYSAAFDRGFMRQLFQRQGIDYKQVIKSPIVDPLIGAKAAVAKGLIKTVKQTNKAGKLYSPSTLESVAKALNTQHKGQAHNAINDCYTLAPTTKKIYETVFGFDFKQTFTQNSKMWQID